MMFGALTQASFSGTFTGDYFQHLCQKDDFLLKQQHLRKVLKSKTFHYH
jgi:hypothetical protein